MDNNLLISAETDSIFDWMQIRKSWENGEWYFSIIDVVQVLTWSKQPSRYWTELKNKLQKDEWYSDLFANTERLKMKAFDGKMRLTDVANTKTLLRIIQSIPSPKAEPFKQRLAQLWNERVEEYNDPELGMQRARDRAIAVYKKKGMSDKDIQIRLAGIQGRNALTDVWKERGIEPKEYAMLTNLWYTWTGLTAGKLKELKWLAKSDPLRDHFSRPEMLLSELAEETALKLTEKKGSKWFFEIQEDVLQGANLAKRAKEDMEKTIGESVVTWYNRLNEKQKQQRKIALKSSKKLPE